MTISEVISLITVLIAAITCSTIFFKFLQSVESKLLKKIDEHEKNMSDKFGSVWRRFDEHKKSIDDKLESAEEKLEMKYLRQDIYKNDYAHLKETLDSQYKSLHELLEQRFKAIDDAIKSCPALTKRNNHDG